MCECANVRMGRALKNPGLFAVSEIILINHNDHKNLRAKTLQIKTTRSFAHLQIFTFAHSLPYSLPS
jgi:hypothetical protein